MSDTVVALPQESGSLPAEIAQFQSRNSLAAKLNYARALADSGLLPAAYRRQPANVLYAVEYGEMLGLSPMAAINGIHVIDGKPTASAALIGALVRRAGHKLRVTGNDQKAVAQIVRKDDPEFTFESVWTLDRARQAGLTSKDVWKRYPAAMLKARAITEVARDACEEALSGVHYTPEELGVEVDEDGVPVAAVEQVQVDWDAEIAKCGGDRDALAELWRRAPNGEIRDKIAEAAKAAGIPPKNSAEDAEGTTPVDAEIVDGDEEQSPTALARNLVDQLIEASDADTVSALIATVKGAPKAAALDVSGIVSSDVAEELGADRGKKLTLCALADQVAKYVHGQGYSVANGVSLADAELIERSENTEQALDQGTAA